MDDEGRTESRVETAVTNGGRRKKKERKMDTEGRRGKRREDEGEREEATVKETGGKREKEGRWKKTGRREQVEGEKLLCEVERGEEERGYKGPEEADSATVGSGPLSWSPKEPSYDRDWHSFCL